MSAVTIEDHPMLVIVEDGAPEPVWMDGRDEGVTASEIHDIAAGSRKSWRRILDGKLNGSTFHGNQHTRAGHEHEPLLIAAVRALPGVITAGGSGALFGHLEHTLHRATPDGFGIEAMLGDFGIEAKWHAAGWAGAQWSGPWTAADIPAEHVDQMQWGMHVCGLGWWLYVVGVEGIDEVQHVWVPRDDTRIGFLARQADAFLEWRAAGAPEIDDIPDVVDDALADYARGLALAAEGTALKNAARPIIEAWAAQHADGDDPLRKVGSRAQVFWQQKTRAVLSEKAWREHEPTTYEEYVTTVARAEAQRAAAGELYTVTAPAPATFRVTANGDEK